ncbi:hypothetical protein AMTRI_Chr13g122080 [Amborella trichopoda]|uniref:Protein kinase domain-containing protein n=1 Tax=Amborella trichopoda TaxID=13333 RepID=U5D6W5_AMBTC|nr:E3 ubiquitin-protein ligase KEG [Amborella trichopoda]XP_020530576.1 E3 ubiquitin-protein ligase KEG [Amborella trichopoda]XP_020530577.1 E3 ubiquitin-protein ligase KEG [Amborella trichopoda]XP_020530578.1 E3 ubiquitin-protein ligase KEG [Amborella trichopoda]ERN17985.1 hypothetical protein AMTR_s00046p00107940 [Amborella trichopoda]|eukprot:XP_020530575.1 E3 ubiquitin-protein ligase KEG [Amborella trichopoda]
MEGSSISKPLATESFEYELYGGDAEHLKTVVATPNQISPWIDPGVLKLKHRIGRGPFGYVWLATLHQSTEDYDEYHEVAVKMLNPIKEADMQAFIPKFEDLFLKYQGLQNVCLLRGISIKNGRVCIVMKFYEGSLGDKMAFREENKLALTDVLRYGVDLAQGILELHTKGVLVLNLKPFNFLLNELDQAILGEFGIPMLLLGISLSSSNVSLRLGTPNYMAPEQWEPGIRGPVTHETDSWGFGCSLVEMLTGVEPWCGKSADEIYRLVVIKQEKPEIPSGLPPAVENVVHGCFEYDLRNRPFIANILEALKSPTTVYGDSKWIALTDKNFDKQSGRNPTEWFLSKDQLQEGDIVRSRKPSNSCGQENMDIPGGKVVSPERDGFVLVRVHSFHDPLRVHIHTLERVTSGFASGDWVRLRNEDNKKQSPIGILHSIDREGNVLVGFIGMQTLWRGHCTELLMAESFCVGQFVRIKVSLLAPRFEWPRKRGGVWETGRICQILPNGCLVVRFPGRLYFGEVSDSLADPSEVEMVSFSNCVGVVKKYQHLEDYHWAVRPLVIALGLLTALKVGLFVGKSVRRSRRKRGGIRGGASGQVDVRDGDGGGNPVWLPPNVAHILFCSG